MDNGNIPKIWGERNRVLLTDTVEIDYLKLIANTFCSKHKHSNKINLFYVLKGKIRIDTEFGNKTLLPGESFVVKPPLQHRFIVLQDSEMIECAFVNDGKIDEKDIDREIQGGRIINGKYMSIPELREKGYLKIEDK